MTVMTLKQAKAVAGVLGSTTKMSGLLSYGLPAAKAQWVPHLCRERGWPIPPQYGCMFGSLLSELEGTPCSVCYADERGNYTYPSLHVGQLKRLIGVFNPLWPEAMVRLIGHYAKPSDPYFRWLDSGDLLNAKMLADIIWIANQLKWITFWLPTQERRLVSKLDKVPSNLIIRISSPSLNEHKVKTFRDFIKSSSISNTGDHNCPSEHYGNTCGPCRLCWDPAHNHTIYKEH
jgi:hypothetical protein